MLQRGPHGAAGAPQRQVKCGGAEATRQLPWQARTDASALQEGWSCSRAVCCCAGLRCLPALCTCNKYTHGIPEMACRSILLKTRHGTPQRLVLMPGQLPILSAHGSIHAHA